MDRADTAELFGRANEAALLRQRLSRTMDGRGSAVLITGEPGIGKTTLVEALVCAAEASGCRVLRSRVLDSPDGEPLSSLRSLSDPSDPLGPSDLTEAFAGASAPTTPDRQHRVTDTIVETLQRAALERPLVVWIDDLQWADNSTLYALTIIVRKLSDHPALIVLSARPTHSGNAEHGVAALAGLDDIEHLGLGPIDATAVEQLCVFAVGAPPAPNLRHVLDGCGGNPFLLVEALSLLVAKDQLLIGEEAELAHGATVTHDLVRARLNGLSPSTMRALELCSILGRNARLDDVAALADSTAMETWQRLVPAVEAGVLTGDVDDLQFRHDLIRAAIYDRVPPALRVALHASAASSLAAWGAPPEALARHYEVCARAGDRQAVASLVEAGERVRYVAPRSATRWLETAFALTPSDGSERQRIVRVLSESYLFGGQARRAQSLARTAIESGVAGTIRVDVLGVLGSALFLDGQLAEAAQIFLEIFEADDTAEAIIDRGVAGVDSALAYLLSADIDAAEELLARVLAGDTSVDSSAYGQAVLGMIHGLRGDLPTGRTMAAAGVNTADGDGSQQAHRNLPHFFLAQVLVWSDDHDAARAAIEEGRSIAEHLGLGWHEPMYHMLLGESYLRTGELDEARSAVEAGLSYAADFDSHVEDARLYSLAAELAIYEGELDHAEHALQQCDQAQRRAGGHGADHMFRVAAMLASAQGRVDDAQRTLVMLWNGLKSIGVNQRLWEIAPDLVQALVDSGRTDRVPEVIATLRRLRPVTRPLTIPWCQALADQDLHGLQVVARKMVAYHRPLQELAQVRLAAANVADTGGAHQLGRALREEAVPFAVGHRDGFVGQRPASWRTSLSPAQLRVADRLRQGMTNAEVAQDLGLSRRTVESHLYHMYPKLGVQSRVELVVLISQGDQ